MKIYGTCHINMYEEDDGYHSIGQYFFQDEIIFGKNYIHMDIPKKAIVGESTLVVSREKVKIFCNPIPVIYKNKDNSGQDKYVISYPGKYFPGVGTESVDITYWPDSDFPNNEFSICVTFTIYVKGTNFYGAHMSHETVLFYMNSEQRAEFDEYFKTLQRN